LRSADGFGTVPRTEDKRSPAAHPAPHATGHAQRTGKMRRLPIVIAVCALALGLAVVGGIAGRGATTDAVARQAASPEAGMEEARPVASPGIERVGCGLISFSGATGTLEANAGPVLEFNEVRFAPGEAIEEKLYPQPVFAYVAYGMVELHLGEVHPGGVAKLWTLATQNSASRPWECAVAEDLTSDVTVTLRAGDAVYLENVTYRIRNPYSRDALLLTAVIDGGGLYDTCRSGCPTWP
jgi:hypothetical protein